MNTVDLHTARAAADACVAEAAKLHVLISVVVVDSHGEVVASARMDGAAGFTHSVARGKARTCTLMSTDSASVAQLGADYPELVEHLSDHAGFRLTMLAGGVVVRDGDAAIGAVGVSGAMPDVDVACAEAGARVLLSSTDAS